MILRVCISLFLLSLSWGQEAKSGIPFSELKTGDEVMQTGRMLQESSMGLHGVEYGTAKWDTVFIAVHGYGSRGYEWVYALRKWRNPVLKHFIIAGIGPNALGLLAGNSNRPLILFYQ